MITLYKGDDTGGQLGKNVKIMFHCDDAVDMDDVVVKFDLLGIVKREFTDVHDGDVLDIFISHAESRKFPLGVIFAKMWGEDASGKLRTFANRIPFRVTLNLIAVYGSDGTDSQDIHVYSSVDWDSIANKPTVFPSSVGEVEGLQEALDEINEKIPFDASADNQLADKEWVDQEIDSVAAYYITYDAAGNPFPTYASLVNAQTVYSGGAVRVPTRNDYCVVLADETHQGAEYRYIYAVAEGQTTGSWQPQFPVEGVMTVDQTVQKNSQNPVSGGGVWSALWGMATTAFSSVYDWCVAQLAGKASKADATLTERFSAWTLSGDVEAGSQYEVRFDYDYEGTILWGLYKDGYLFSTGSDNPLSTSEDFHYGLPGEEYTITATRTALPGYKLGSQTDKPLASEAEAEALRTGKQDALTAQQLANIAAVSNALAFDATHSYAAGDPVVYNGTLYTFTAAHTGAWTGSDVAAVDIIARLAGKMPSTATGADISVDATQGAQKINAAINNADGKATDAQNTAYQARNAAAAADNTAHVALNTIPYTLTTKTISNGAVTLDDRAANAVTISTTLSPNTLTVNFPTATSGKVRDFALRLNIAAGVTAPEIAWPQGVTLENDGGEVPEIADGGTGSSSTILYFSETENNGTTAKFLVKGETLTAITQA